MLSRILRVSASFLCFVLFSLALANGQAARGSVAGHVVDSSGAVLPGAKIELQPGGATAVSDTQGQFTIYNVVPGSYTVTVNYVGFDLFSQPVTVTAGQLVRVSASLKVGSANENIVVTSERGHGEAEAINVERESDNILQVLPVEVITSLPNTNIADAIGRLPSVTLERDEGEGKYVQIRGAQPAWNNVTVNGMELASPESVRQIKLDIVPANLVDSVEINKTLSANQDGDAIGGSVNLVTKQAEERPTVYINGIGGYTPIVNGRGLDEFDGTIGQRFGQRKRLGILFGASYDWNGRGINDVEPVPDIFQGTPTYDTEDIRDYRYNRTRIGFTSSIDYKLSDISGLYLRLLYSHFDNFGDRWLYTPSVGTFATPTLTNPDGTMSANVQARRPVQVIGSLDVGGKHVFGDWLVLYELGISRASSEDHGYASADFNGSGASLQNLTFAIDPNIHTPRFLPQGGVNIFDQTQYTFADLDVSQTYSPQLNLSLSGSAARNYHAGSHFGTFEFGFKIRNAHKFQDSLDPVYDAASGTGPTLASFGGSFTNPHYYDGAYGSVFAQQQADYGKIEQFYLANLNNPNVLALDATSTAQNGFPNNFDLIERVTAGYVMNTLQFGRIRLQTGLRFEGTNENLTGFQVFFDSNGNICQPGESAVDPTCPANITGPFSTLRRNNSYLNVFPSAQVRFGLGADSDIRVSYGRGIARPNFGDLPPTFANNGSNNEIDIGNPDLKATYANNFDVIIEQYLKPFGIIQGGFFYKQVSDPIYEQVKEPLTAAVAQQFDVDPIFATNPPTWNLSRPINGQSANLYGFEIAYLQHLNFLPGPLRGFGISANYGYTHSTTDGVPLRTDKPALARQAPHTFNFSPTYDRGRLSARMGLAYNGANIFGYNYQNLNPDGSPNPQPFGIKGPFGDTYLLAHTQVDAQAAFRMYRGLQFIFAGLNLTNEVFGFYNGSPQFPIQREYYKPSYEFGLRYTLSGESK